MKSATCFLRIVPVLLLLFGIQMICGSSLQAQIYEPEGLSMPGAWNSWNNPPYNNLALASSTEVTGGRVVKFSTGIQRWQTILSVAATGGDLTGGTYEWLFTSGPTGNPWGNKWANVNVVMNTLQQYAKEGANNNTITLVNGKWYTVNFEDAGYVDTRAIFMETSNQPSDISFVSVPAVVNPGNAVSVTVTLSAAPGPEELFYLRYSTDAWATSAALPVSVTGTSGTVEIPGQPAGTNVSYYVFSSTVPGLTTDFDLYSIKMQTNGGINFSYTVTTPTPVITFANLQNPPAGTIEPLQNYLVTGRAGVPGLTGLPLPAAGLEAWIGYSLNNSDPALWTNWIPAAYSLPASGYDEFSANLGASMSMNGTYYYATRFRLNGGSFVYGGYSATGGGFWTGIDYVSGVLSVQAPVVPIFLALGNTSVSGEQNVCYNAKNTITVAGSNTTFEVQSGASVTMIAGYSIIFLPTSIIHQGSNLHGYITTTGEYCYPAVSPSMKSAEFTEAPANKPEGIAFRIFPNPATSQVIVDLHGVMESAATRFELYGIRGEVVASQEMTGPGSMRIDLSGMSPGVYVIRMISGKDVQTKMLVKQ